MNIQGKDAGISAGWFAALLAVALSDPALPQSRDTTTLEYDASGNTVRIESARTSSPPVVDALAPASLRRGESTSVWATGSGLLNASVEPDDSALAVSGVTTDSTEVTFTLEVSDNAALGRHDITFATSLGSAPASLEVLPVRPSIRIAPVPMDVRPGGQVSINIHLSSVDTIDHVLSIQSGDESVFSASPNEVTIPAGSLSAAAPVIGTGVAPGATPVTVSGALGTQSVTAFVTGAFTPPGPSGSEQVLTFFARPLGVVRDVDEPPDLVDRGPFTSQLGVVKQAPPGPAGEAARRSFAPLVGIVRDAAVLTVAPRTVRAGQTQVEVVVAGVGLSAATSAAVEPGDGVTVGDVVPALDGESVAITLSVDTGTPLTRRRIVLSTPDGGAVSPASPGADRLFIGGGLPRIESISPVVVNRGDSLTLRVRGAHLHELESIGLVPGDGITFGSDAGVNAAGTEATVSLLVGPFALLGPRAVTVTTATGTSPDALTAANTLTVADNPGETFESLVAPGVGVFKERTVPPDTRSLEIRNAHLSVVRGSVMTALQPSVRAIGASFRLTVVGAGLSQVTDLSFAPDTGIAVDTLDVPLDGGSVSANVTIAEDAPRTLRTVALKSGGTTIPVASPGANRFQVTSPQPVLSSVAPDFLVKGEALKEIVIRGEFLDDVVGVSVVPGDGIEIDTPVENGAGAAVTVPMRALADAASGERAVVVETAIGITSSTPGPFNSIEIASDATTFDKFVAPAVGVVKETTEPPVTVTRTFIAPVLGVEKQFTPPPAAESRQLYTDLLGVAKGTTAFRVSPTVVPIESSPTLIIDGAGLDRVASVAIEPQDGISIDATFFVNQDGTQLSLPITVAADAPQTVRRIALQTVDGGVGFADLGNSRVEIAGPQPIIESVTPIQQVRGASFELLIRGFNLTGTTAVNAAPAAGLSFSTPTVNAAGTEVRVTTVIDAAADAGPRAITVTTPAGTSDNTATPANTFTVVE